MKHQTAALNPTPGKTLKSHLRFTLPLILSVLVISSCKNKQKEGFTVTGKIPEIAGKMILLKELDPKETIRLDSVKAGSSGEFTLQEKTGEAGFYLLQFPDHRDIVLCMEKGESLEFEGIMRDFPANMNMTGSPETILLRTFYAQSLNNKKKVDALKESLRAAEGTPGFYKLSQSADSAYRKIAETQKALEKEFIDKHTESLACLLVLNFALSGAPVLTMDEDLDYYKKLTALSARYPTNKHVIFHQKRITVFLDKKFNPKF